MAFASADLQKMWSSMTTLELREKSMFYNMMDHSWESEWVQGANTVNIPKPTWAGTTAAVRARGGAWPTAADGNQDNVSLTRSGGRTVSNELGYEDVLEIPWSVVERHRNRQMYEIAHAIDTAMYDAARGFAGTTHTIGTGGSTFISRTSPYNYTLASGKRHPMADLCDRLAIAFYRANAIDKAASPRDGAGRPFTIQAPEVVLSFSQWLEQLGLHFDPLTSELLRDNPASFAGGDYAGRYHGIDIYSWNHIGVPTGTDNWPGYAAIPQAVAVGIRPTITQYFDIQNNQVSTKPAHLLRQLTDYAIVEVEDGWHFKTTIHAD